MTPETAAAVMAERSQCAAAAEGVVYKERYRREVNSDPEDPGYSWHCIDGDYSNARNDAAAAIRARPAPVIEPAGDGWQKIETAPFATDVLLGWIEYAQWCQEVGQASWGWRNEVVSNMSWHGRATHWRPLPPPPALADLQRAELQRDAQSARIAELEAILRALVADAGDLADWPELAAARAAIQRAEGR